MNHSRTPTLRPEWNGRGQCNKDGESNRLVRRPAFRPGRGSHGRYVFLLVLLFTLVSMPPATGRSQEPTEQPAQYSLKLPTKGQVSSKVSFLVELAPKSAGPGEVVTLSVKATIEDDWHIGAMGSPSDGAPTVPTVLTFGGKGLTAIDPDFTASIKPEVVLVGGEKHLQHAGTVTWVRKYRVGKGASGPAGAGSIRFQACDELRCLPTNVLEFSLGVAASDQVPGAKVKTRPYKTIGEPIRLALSGSKLERKLIDYTKVVTADSEKDFDKYVKQLTSAMKMNEGLPLRAEFRQGASSVGIYIPDQEQYPLTNSGSSDTRFGNTSTFVSIDHNGDGEIADYESVPTNLPIRLFDSMFLVKRIDKAGLEITLQELDIPLAGAVLGRKCPAFWYETVDGRVISNESILGTVTILDIWAVT